LSRPGVAGSHAGDLPPPPAAGAARFRFSGPPEGLSLAVPARPDRVAWGRDEKTFKSRLRWRALGAPSLQRARDRGVRSRRGPAQIPGRGTPPAVRRPRAVGAPESSRWGADARRPPGHDYGTGDDLPNMSGGSRRRGGSSCVRVVVPTVILVQAGPLALDLSTRLLPGRSHACG
jgi:hypothetical protein